MSEDEDDERVILIGAAVRYGFKWAMVLGTLFLMATAIFAPDRMIAALWWYPISFVVMFLWKRNCLLNQAH